MNKKIDGYKLNFSNSSQKKILGSIKSTLKSGNLSSGKNVLKLENYFKNKFNYKYAIACSSGGGALELIFNALNLKNKDVLVPTNTFIATYNAIKFSGANPILIDTGKNDLNVNLKEIKKKVTKKTKCVCLVHVGSYVPSDIIEIVRWCKKKKIILIEDCAHCFNTSFKGTYAGNFGIAGAFSFFATKTVTGGEGGLVVTSNKSLFKKIQMLKSYGMSKQFNSYDYKYFSGNYRMNEAEAIITLTHIGQDHLSFSARAKIKQQYDKNLKKYFDVYENDTKSNLYKYVCILKTKSKKKKLIKFLKSKNIFLSGDVYQRPLHLSKLLKKESSNLSRLPNSEDVCARHICLPMYYGLKSKSVNKIIKELINFSKIT